MLMVSFYSPLPHATRSSRSDGQLCSIFGSLSCPSNWNFLRSSGFSWHLLGRVAFPLICTSQLGLQFLSNFKQESAKCSSAKNLKNLKIQKFSNNLKEVDIWRLFGGGLKLSHWVWTRLARKIGLKAITILRYLLTEFSSSAAISLIRKVKLIPPEFRNQLKEIRSWSNYQSSSESLNRGVIILT